MQNTISSSNKRIAKNTLALYFRQILVMLVGLYTVRVVLETLGVEDYGLYNVVAGVVSMFGFLSGTMALASQRYFSFELGRDNLEYLKKIFSIFVIIYLLIGLAIVLLSETVGLWFVSNKLVIPHGRERAAMWVYQCSILSFLCSILTSPYMAMIIAHEDMKIFAYMSIADVLLKLGVVFVLCVSPWDKLQLYGILMCAVALMMTSTYRLICLKRYEECKFSFYWNKGLFKEIISYSGWNLFGASIGIFKNQMLNIVMNQFFGPAMIAARGIAISVSNATTSFSQNFSTALNPQTIKSYAAGHKERMLLLVFRGSKTTYLLMYLLVLPLLLEMPIILQLWLRNPPAYAALFTRLVLLGVLIVSVSYPLAAVAQATGKIKLYQSVVGGAQLLNLPISWGVLAMGGPPYAVMIVSIIIEVIVFIARLFILKRLIAFPIRSLIKKVLLPISVVSILSAVLPVASYCYFEPSILRVCLVAGLNALSVMLFSYFIALNREEREKVRSMMISYMTIKRRGV